MTSVVSELLCLRDGSGGSPLFCMHYGNFTSVAAALEGGQPIYAIRSTGIGAAAGELTIGLLAQEYLQKVRAVQPQGPYRLLGYSFGGLVAYDMARLLIEAGESIGLLALFDAPNPRFRDGLSAAELDAVQRKYRADRRGKYWRNVKAGRVDRLASDLWRLGVKAMSPLLRRLRKATNSRVGQSSAPPSDEARINALWHAYQPTTLNLRMVLFRAQGRDAEFGNDESMGWRRCVAGGVEVQFAQGIHEKMMHSPYADDLAAQVNPYLHEELQPTPVVTGPANR